MYKIFCMIGLATVLVASCEMIEPKEPTYKVGQTVIHKISGYKGSVLSMWDSCYRVSDDCRYYIRFTTPDKVAPFYTMEAREFEIRIDE